ncbi:MAG: NUDIX domain-containing protein [Pseudomonadota bacterium]
MTDDDGDAIREISTTILSDRWVRLTRHEFERQHRDGSRQTHVREVHDHGNGVACLLHDAHADTLLLTRQFRLPVHLSGQLEHLIEVPAGLMEGDDKGAQMQKELLEETGYQASDLRQVLETFMSPGSVTEQVTFFVGTYDKSNPQGPGGGNSEEGEDIEVLHMPVTEARAMLLGGRIRDGKTAILLQHFFLITYR